MTYDELIKDINQLGDKLCRPVGGVGPTISVAEESVLASTQLMIPATPTYPPSVTGLDQASSILATASLTPNLGNPLGGSEENAYPTCAGTCVNQTAALLTDPHSLSEVCGVEYRTQNAVCEVALCLNREKQITQLLGQQACRPYYAASNSTLGAAVSASLASATPIAQAAVASNPDVLNVANYPACAV
ncbi:MAG: hypothetical protein Q9219_005658 [cf. Caloplaca sp. 3 TL-2023]